ncbi:hypothetical protein GIB67_008438 [Kingdonia uniflora]|uniref:RNase H type-1 domain-containing protein n=1 Tax=Kingdonia uniflora TaxID=39325 RepID=A0A7J7N534_9MAGN|nr:hypothetical protein GIB67_008438 [Kingdonia uniflora]
MSSSLNKRATQYLVHRTKPPTPSWQPSRQPPTAQARWHIINVDAAWSKPDELGGTGFTIKSHMGHETAWAATSEEAEVISVIRGIEAGQRLGLDRVIILTDCQRLVQAYRDRSDDLSWGALTLTPDMLAIAALFRDFIFDFTERSCNFEAHFLAARGTRCPTFECLEPDEAKNYVDSVLPPQGHINPLGQFAKRLVSKGLKATLVTTIFLSKTTQFLSGSVGLEIISDGYDDGGFAKAENIQAYLHQIEVVGSRTLGKLIEKQASNGTPVKGLVYDAFFPWGLDLAKRYGIMGEPFSTQPWTVNSIYYHFFHGLLKVPDLDPMVSIPGLPPLRLEDLPGFISSPASYPAYLNMTSNQFSNLEKADLVFDNTFEKLEVEVLS